MLHYSSIYWISVIAMITLLTITGGARVIEREFEPRRTWNYIEKYKVERTSHSSTHKFDLNIFQS